MNRLLHKSVDKVTVIAHNKDAYSVRIGSGVVPTIQEFDEVVKKIIKETEISVRGLPGFDNWTLSERGYMRICEQAFRIARHFKWTMEGGLV